MLLQQQREAWRQRGNGGSGSLPAAQRWQRRTVRQQHNGSRHGRAASLAAWQQQGIISGSTAAGSVAAARQRRQRRQQRQQHLAGSAAEMATGSASAARWRQAWPWQPLPLLWCHRTLVKYYLIKDKVDQKEKTIEHCPTEQMWTDINTKLKKGLSFECSGDMSWASLLITTS